MSVRKHAILIVEHDPIVRSMYVRTLEQRYEVLVAQTVDQVVMHGTHPDLWAVVIEPHRPDGLGGAFLDVIYHYAHERHITVLVCSVLDAQDMPHRNEHTHYFVKPVAPDSLRTFIEHHQML